MMRAPAFAVAGVAAAFAAFAGYAAGAGFPGVGLYLALLAGLLGGALVRDLTK